MNPTKPIFRMASGPGLQRQIIITHNPAEPGHAYVQAGTATGPNGQPLPGQQPYIIQQIYQYPQAVPGATQTTCYSRLARCIVWTCVIIFILFAIEIVISILPLDPYLKGFSFFLGPLIFIAIKILLHKCSTGKVKGQVIQVCADGTVAADGTRPMASDVSTQTHFPGVVYTENLSSMGMPGTSYVFAPLPNAPQWMEMQDFQATELRHSLPQQQQGSGIANNQQEAVMTPLPDAPPPYEEISSIRVNN